MDDRRVEVEWLDSLGEGGWSQRDEALRRARDDPMRHSSCGYLLEDAPNYLLLCLNRHGSGQIVGETIQIPRVAILAIHNLRRGR
jgi:hypothetical protein